MVKDGVFNEVGQTAAFSSKTVNVLVPGELCLFLGPAFCTGNYTRSQGSCQTLLGLHDFSNGPGIKLPCFLSLRNQNSHLVCLVSSMRIEDLPKEDAINPKDPLADGRHA